MAAIALSFQIARLSRGCRCAAFPAPPIRYPCVQSPHAAGAASVATVLGALQTPTHRFGSRAYTSLGPLCHQAWEGGLRGTSFVHGPGIVPGKRIADLAHAIDWLPTIVSFVGGASDAFDPTFPLDGACILLGSVFGHRLQSSAVSRSRPVRRGGVGVKRGRRHVPARRHGNSGIPPGRIALALPRPCHAHAGRTRMCWPGAHHYYSRISGMVLCSHSFLLHRIWSIVGGLLQASTSGRR